MGRGERLVSRPRTVRREAVVSLDTGRAPAMLLRSGNRSLGLYAFVRNIFDIFVLPQVPFIDRGRNFARIYGTTSLKRRAVECGHCSVPVDSLNVPKSTSRSPSENCILKAASAAEKRIVNTARQSSPHESSEQCLEKGFPIALLTFMSGLSWSFLARSIAEPM